MVYPVSLFHSLSSAFGEELLSHSKKTWDFSLISLILNFTLMHSYISTQLHSLGMSYVCRFPSTHTCKWKASRSIHPTKQNPSNHPLAKAKEKKTYDIAEQQILQITWKNILNLFYSNCVSEISSIAPTWELVREAASQLLDQLIIRICIWTRSLGDLFAY